MSFPVITTRVVGSTESCFADLINSRPGLVVHELLAEFCGKDVTVETVQMWQRGSFFPGGLQLLQLRCFMSLAGYGVEEMAQLEAQPRRIGYAICFGIIDAATVKSKLGYNAATLQPVWRLVLRGGTAQQEFRKNLPRVLTIKMKQEVTAREAHWKEVIEQRLGLPSIAPGAPAPVIAPEIHPGFAISFARLVAATTALGNPLLVAPELRQAVLNATRSGQDLTELIGILRQFLPDEG